jgi:transcriptional regulator with XRE-family HTH domain
MNRLQQLREAAGLSQADLGRRSDVTPAVIEQLEAGVNVTETDRVILTPGQPDTDAPADLLSRLANALNGSLFDEGVAVTPAELLQPATGDLPVKTEALADPGEITQPSMPIIGVNFPPAKNLPPEARSHNSAEQPDDIDAALEQLAINSQVAASDKAARLKPIAGNLSAERNSMPNSEMSPPVPAPEMPETVSKPEMPASTPRPEMPGQAPKPEIREPVPGPEMSQAEANLGLTTDQAVLEVPPKTKPPLKPAPAVSLSAGKPVQDDAPLTTPVPDQMPAMQPYLKPGPTEAQQSRYKLPASTVVPSLIGVAVALSWYAWRSWRRAKTNSEKVTPYYINK